MKLFELFATLTLDDKGFTNGVNRATAAGKQMAGGLNGATVKAVALGNALYNAGIKAAQMAGSFVKSSIEAAAQVQAEKAQFEAAFGEMAGFATKALKNVQGETGILYTRLRTVGTKAFSQLKGAGLGAADAMAAMEKYTSLAADAAAYYDISIEEADAKLRSFMRGNTEAGDAIGLFTSEAQRNERAVEKYGKKWLQLTEAQKQMLMLDIAGGIYEQSGAIGQAARESDSWANIIGNLDSAWTNAIAKIGEPVKESVTPALQAVIDKLGDEETLTKIEQFGLGLADKITALYEGEDSPVQNVLAFVGDIASALGSDTGKSVLTAVGAVGAIIWGLSSPLNAVILTIGLIIKNWKKVKDAVADVGRQIKMLFGGEAGVPTQGDYKRWSSLSPAERAQAVEFGEYTQAENDLFSAYESNPEQPDPMGAFDSFNGSNGTWGDTSGWSTPDNPFGIDMSEIEAYESNPKQADPPNAFGQTNSSNGTWGDTSGWSTPDNPFGVDLSTLGIPGYAKGLNYVPYDNYVARLHRGEEILTAAEARQRRSGQGADVSALYSAVAAAVREGVSRIAINMDGQRVGRAVAGSVAREQARMTNNDLRAGGYVMA